MKLFQPRLNIINNPLASRPGSVILSNLCKGFHQDEKIDSIFLFFCILRLCLQRSFKLAGQCRGRCRVSKCYRCHQAEQLRPACKDGSAEIQGLETELKCVSGKPKVPRSKGSVWARAWRVPQPLTGSRGPQRRLSTQVFRKKGFGVIRMKAVSSSHFRFQTIVLLLFPEYGCS